MRVRYRCDAERKLRLKTVELIVESTTWILRPRNQRRKPDDLIGVRVPFEETELRSRIKAAGGIWRPRHRLWKIDWRTVRELGLEGRVVEGEER